MNTHMPAQAATRRPAQAGFNLIELLIVITIIGVLMGIVVMNFGATDDAKQTAAKAELRTIELALERYRAHNAHFPSSAQGLKALVEKPSGDPQPAKWAEYGYLKGKEVPKDPWNREYLYLNPGNNGEIDIYSLGKDGRESDDDIGNWQAN